MDSISRITGAGFLQPEREITTNLFSNLKAACKGGLFYCSSILIGGSDLCIFSIKPAVSLVQYSVMKFKVLFFKTDYCSKI